MPADPAGSSGRRREPTVKITAVRWLQDPVVVFNATVAKYHGLSLYFGERRN